MTIHWAIDQTRAATTKPELRASLWRSGAELAGCAVTSGRAGVASGGNRVHANAPGHPGERREARDHEAESDEQAAARPGAVLRGRGRIQDLDRGNVARLIDARFLVLAREERVHLLLDLDFAQHS